MAGASGEGVDRAPGSEIALADDLAACVHGPGGAEAAAEGAEVEHAARLGPGERVDLESGKTSIIASSEAGRIENAHFSPDGKWIAYSKQDRDLRPHIYVTPSTGGSEHHVGNDDVLFSETTPMWTPDGKRLLFLAGLAQAGSATRGRFI